VQLYRSTTNRRRCHRLARWSLTLDSYTKQQPTRVDATGLPGGASRCAATPHRTHTTRRCHRLARWSLTLDSYTKQQPTRVEATGGASRCAATPHRTHTTKRCHRLARWSLTLHSYTKQQPTRVDATGLPGGASRCAAIQSNNQSASMPPACPVEHHIVQLPSALRRAQSLRQRNPANLHLDLASPGTCERQTS
jgi:hypothetical protein